MTKNTNTADKTEQVLRSIDFESNDKLYFLKKLNEYNDTMIEYGYTEYSEAYINDKKGRKLIVDKYLDDCYYDDVNTYNKVKEDPDYIFELDSDHEYVNENDDYIQYFVHEGIVTTNIENVKEFLSIELAYYDRKE